MPLHRRRRLIKAGGQYTEPELDAGEVELEQVAPADEPPVDEQGEPWGWTKPGPRPRGWREDGNYGAD